VITAPWSKYYLIGLLWVLCLWVQAQPTDKQENPFANTDLTGNEKLKFNELFFQAEKQKNLGNLREAEGIYLELYALNKQNATVSFELGQVYLASEQPIKAVEFAERAHKLDRENRWFTLLLVAAYRAAGEIDKEIKTHKKLIEQEPEQEGHYFELSNAYLRANELEKALEPLTETERFMGVNENVVRQKKQIYLQLGDVQGAVGEMEKLIAAYPQNLDYYGTLAKLYEANGFDEEAYQLYQKMLEISPEDPRPNLDLALYYQNRKESVKSIRYLKKAMASPQLEIDRKIPVLLSLFDLLNKDSVLMLEADTIFRSVMEATPTDPKAYAIYADFLSRQNRAEEALWAYKQAIQKEGGSERFQIWEQILLIQIQMQAYDSLAIYGPQAVELFPNQPLPYFFSGAALNALGKPTEALTYLEDGLVFTLGNAPLKEQFYLQLADAYHKLEQHEQSDTYFDKVLALNPNNASALNNYAYYLSVRNKRLDDALKMSIESNRIAPDNLVFLDTWAWILYQQKKYDDALIQMEKAVALSSNPDPEVLQHYGDILFALGKKEAARTQWQKALELGGDKEALDQRLKKAS
jgi:tetratricopeptide (TPR) repeat protein